MMGSGKKGVSIGAAMKQRMSSQEGTPEQLPTPDLISQQTEEANVLESFNTRLPRSLQRRMKMYAASEGVKIQDVVQQALEEYLRKKESKKD